MYADYSEEVQNFKHFFSQQKPFKIFKHDEEGDWAYFTTWNKEHLSQYAITSKGKVKRMHRDGEFYDINPVVINNKHLAVILSGFSDYSGENQQATYALAKAVATAFIPNPYHAKRVKFKDGDTFNCNVENLEWNVSKSAKILAEKGLL